MAKRRITEEKDFLFECILSLSTVEECYGFFEDLCTPKEIEEMSKRMKAAKMLSDAKGMRLPGCARRAIWVYWPYTIL